MLPESALREMKVMWATPCYISAVSMGYVTSMFALEAQAMHKGMYSALFMRAESLITRARNKMVIDFIEQEYTHLFWIDSDIAFSPEAAFRLLRADRDIVAGVYPLKKMNWPAEGLPAGMTQAEFEVRYTEYAFNPHGHVESHIGQYVDDEGFVEVIEASTGFMCIKRQVFLDMMKHYPELNYVPDGPLGHPQAHLHYRLFDCIIDPDSGRYLSEDYGFCRRWRDMGGKIWIDLDSKLKHLGQWDYKGDFTASMRSQGRL